MSSTNAAFGKSVSMVVTDIRPIVSCSCGRQGGAQFRPMWGRHAGSRRGRCAHGAVVAGPAVGAGDAGGLLKQNASGAG